MTYIRIMLLSVLLFSVFMFTPATAHPDSGCVEGVRAAFRKVSDSTRKLLTAVQEAGKTGKEITKWERMREGRTQAENVEKIIDGKVAEAEKAAVDGNKDRAWSDVVKKWEDDVTDRMTDKGSDRYPSVDELLALMAAKSPSFKSGLIEFLTNHGNVRFKLLAHFMETIQTAEKGVGEIGGKVTYGKRLWGIWQNSIRLPMRKAWTPDDFALFMTETSGAMFRAMHPEPGWSTTWLKAFGEVRMDPKTWKVWQNFANRFLLDYRGRYKAFMEGVSEEAYGKPRPDVIRDFYRFGMWDTVYRHLAAFKTMLSKSGGKIIEGKGLTLEELDAMNDGPLYNKLPRSLKNALIVANHPELYNDILFNNEVEQLSLEVMFFVRPVISGLFLYYTMIEPTYGAYETNEDRKKFEKDVKANPEKYLPQTKHADDDRITNFDAQLNQFKGEKATMEAEMKNNPAMPEADVAMRRRSIAKFDKRINNLEQLRSDLLRTLPQAGGQ